MLRDTGEMPITCANDANIPVICHLCEPDRENGMWVWYATNFMPRKERLGGTYRLEADTKDEIMEALRKHVIPLYEAALINMQEHGENYYWELKSNA